MSCCGPVCSTPMTKPTLCPECRSVMDQIYHSERDFFSDDSEGSQYHWKCPKCGHEEAKRP